MGGGKQHSAPSFQYMQIHMPPGEIDSLELAVVKEYV